MTAGELTRATVRLDKDLEPMKDERGRPVFRMRKHYLEEFAEVVFRHGVYKRDLELFFTAARRSKQGNLLEEPKKPSAPPSPPIPTVTKGARGNA